MPQLELEDLSFSYSGNNDNQVIRDMSWSAKGSETIGIIGANGAGKSTLLKLVVGLQLNYTGTININGLVLQKATLKSIREKLGYVFQDSDSQLFMSRVWDDVAFGPRNHGFTEEQVAQRTMAALKQVHIQDLKDKQIYRLSGGQKKLVSLATILSFMPEIVLLDEPSVALDPANRRSLIHVLNGLAVMKLIASHDLDFIYDTCQRTILINKGRVVADGPTTDILQDKTLLVANGLELPLSFSRR